MLYNSINVFLKLSNKRCRLSLDLTQKLFKTFIILSISALSSQSFALTLDQYLQQVQKSNNDYNSNKILAEAGYQRSKEGFLITSPQLTANTSYLSDSTPPVSQPLKGTKTEYYKLNIGIAKQFETGTSMKLEYDNSYTDINNSSPALVQHQHFWYTKPIISIEQPLFRNWLGKETQAMINLKNSQAQASGHLSNFNMHKTIMDAKISYWDLATTIANIKVKQESVNRAKKLLDWAEKRNKLGLGQDSDLLQAQSALLQREYELQAFLDLKRTKTRLFNALRNIQSDTINDELETYNSVQLGKQKSINKQLPPGIREDLKAKYQKYLITKNQAEVAEQKITPNFNLKLQYYPSGRDDNYIKTASEAFRAKHNTYAIGLNFDMPLDLQLNRNLISAYKSETHAAELEYKQAEFEVTKEWRLLAQQYFLLNNQLKLAEQITKTQEKKLTNEQKLLKNGRTTTYQVIQFEQDLLNSEFQYYTTKNRLLNIIAAIELFNA